MNEKERKNGTEAGRMRARRRSVLSMVVAIAAIALAVVLTVLIMPKADLNGTGTVGSEGKEDDAAIGMSADRTYTVTGTVSHGETGLSGAYIGYYIGESYLMQYAVTDTDGRYTIPVPIKTYADIQPPSKNGFLTDDPGIRAAAGNATMDFAMYPDGMTSFSLSGKATFCGDGVDGVEIIYTMDGGAESIIYSDRDGRYAIEAPAGSMISITAAAKEEYMITSPMNFHMGDDIDADIRMYHPEQWVMVIIDPNNNVDDYYLVWVEKGNTVPRPEDTKMNSFVISGWYSRGSEWDFDTPISDVVIIYAEYTYDSENWFAVTLDMNNFTLPWIWHVHKDSPYLERPFDPRLDAFAFKGWYVDGIEWDFGDPVTADMTLTAMFDYDENDWFFVTFDPNNNTSAEPPVAAVGKNDPYAVRPLRDPVKNLSTFVAWYLDDEEWDFGTPIDGDITLTAQYVIDTRFFSLVTFDPNNGDDAKEVWVENLTTIPTAYIPEKFGYVFAGWYINGYEWDLDAKIWRDITLTAGYEYCPGAWALVTFDPDNGDDVTEIWALKGTSVPWTDDPKKHLYIFEGWYVNGKEWKFDGPVVKDMTITAKYSHDPEHWAFVMFEKDNGRPAERAWYEPGSLLQGPDDPKKHKFVFDAWHCNGSEWDFGTPVRKNTVLVAQYSYDREFWAYVTFDPDNGKSVTATWVEKGMKVKPAEPKKHSYIFEGWYHGGSLWDPRTPIADDTAFVAQYSRDPAFWTFIDVTSNEGGSFEHRLNGEGPFLPFEGPTEVLIGTPVEMAAIPDPGYVFIWDDGTHDIARFIAGNECPKGTFVYPAVLMTAASDVPAGTPADGTGGVPGYAALLLSLLALALIISVFLLRERK